MSKIKLTKKKKATRNTRNRGSVRYGLDEDGIHPIISLFELAWIQMWGQTIIYSD